MFGKAGRYDVGYPVRSMSAKVLPADHHGKTFVIIDESGNVSPYTEQERYFAYVASITEDYDGFGEIARWNRERYNEPNEKKAQKTSMWGRISLIDRLRNIKFSSKAEVIDKSNPPSFWTLKGTNGKKKRHFEKKKKIALRMALLSHLLDYALEDVQGTVVVIIDEHEDLIRSQVIELCKSKSNQERTVTGDVYPSQITKDWRSRLASNPDTFRHIDVLQTNDYVTYAVRRYIEGKPVETNFIGTEVRHLKEDD